MKAVVGVVFWGLSLLLIMGEAQKIKLQSTHSIYLMGGIGEAMAESEEVTEKM